MKGAAKVLVFINFLLTLTYLLLMDGNISFKFSVPMVYYAIYSMIMSFLSFASLNGNSKKAINACAVFYLPIGLFPSIFMFCINENSLG